MEYVIKMCKFEVELSRILSNEGRKHQRKVTDPDTLTISKGKKFE